MNARLLHEHTATFRQSRVSQFFYAVKRRQLDLKVSLQIPLGDGRGVAFRKIKPGCGKPDDDECHRQKQFRAETGRVGFLRLARRGHGKST